jgi:hypothetical protein
VNFNCVAEGFGALLKDIPEALILGLTKDEIPGLASIHP